MSEPMEELMEEPSSQTKQVIVVRKDLNMRKGKIGAQSAHASRAFLTQERVHGPRSSPADFTGEIELWLQQGQRTICVCVDSEEELLGIHATANAKGLVSNLITDAGHTEFNGIPTRTCLAIGPHLDTKFEGVTDHLRLF